MKSVTTVHLGSEQAFRGDGHSIARENLLSDLRAQRGDA
ncbi:hypothetical protein CAPI_08820 [Corynebacterium capitovis DSM 44611]|nr:hypothetical protein CAPI_08820 [Corynebacterium capitovis DSM 44611]